MSGSTPEKGGLPSENKESTSLSTTLWENYYPILAKLTQALTPGNILFFSSFPFCYRAYRDYHRYSEMIRKSRAHAEDNKLGMMVASRALGIATRGSVGCFALVGSFVFFVNGWSSMSDAVQSTQNWATSRRQRLITLFGLKDRNNEDHPDFAETKHMTDEQKLNYLAKKYFVEDDTEKDS